MVDVYGFILYSDIKCQMIRYRVYTVGHSMLISRPIGPTAVRQWTVDLSLCVSSKRQAHGNYECRKRMGTNS